ncbi:hypothetical protein SPBR_04600 [Sporothrix brasiliensis 5110]|uniref:Ubiquitin-like protease family profile domain-containing protein n=1 Tax=Sporothrix brasiliensis 5110 TaxID=1398154 RepID=A0A0C2IDF7_9PEZI|nr:uncharacterized protein SPBR_04600 [Sporothrix brasiliensis 5110]KIH87311.1 hypothetical protein SPBR_04600 [Sporothrix brasiliensis 5110]
MPRKVAPVSHNPPCPEDAFHVDDIRVFGLAAYKAVVAQQDIIQTGREACNTILSSVLPRDVAPTVTNFLLSGARGLTKKDKAILYNCTALRRVERQWGIEDIGRYGWHRHGKTFCDSLRTLSKQLAWTEAAPLVRRVMFDGDVGQHGAKALDLSLQLCHVETIRQNPASITPLAGIADLPPEQQDNFELDRHGFLQRSVAGQRRWLQNEALRFRVRLDDQSVAHVAADGALSEVAVNVFLQHLTRHAKADAKVLFRRAAAGKDDLSGVLTISDTERRFFDSVAAPFRCHGWWYVAVWPDVRRAQRTVLALSQNAPRRPLQCPTETDVLVLPDAAHDKFASNFLVFPCLRAVVAGLARFNGAIQRHQICCSTDVPTVVAEVKEIVAASILRSRQDKARVEHDAAAKQTRDAAEAPARLDSGSSTRDNHLELLKGLPAQHDLKTLDDGQLLNDAIVNFGLYTIGKRHPNNTFFFNSFLITNWQLQRGKVQGQPSCAKWTKGTDLTSYDCIVVPIHDPDRVHWLGAILWRNTPKASTKKNADCAFKLTILDSLGANASGHDAYRAAVKACLAPIRIIDQPAARVPQQTNAWSCGDHLLRNIDSALRSLREFTRAVAKGASLEWEREMDEKNQRATLKKAAEETLKENPDETLKAGDAATESTNTTRSGASASCADLSVVLDTTSTGGISGTAADEAVCQEASVAEIVDGLRDTRFLALARRLFTAYQSSSLSKAYDIEAIIQSAESSPPTQSTPSTSVPVTPTAAAVAAGQNKRRAPETFLAPQRGPKRLVAEPSPGAAARSASLPPQSSVGISGLPSPPPSDSWRPSTNTDHCLPALGVDGSSTGTCRTQATLHLPFDPVHESSGGAKSATSERSTTDTPTPCPSWNIDVSLTDYDVDIANNHQYLCYKRPPLPSLVIYEEAVRFLKEGGGGGGGATTGWIHKILSEVPTVCNCPKELYEMSKCIDRGQQLVEAGQEFLPDSGSIGEHIYMRTQEAGRANVFADDAWRWEQAVIGIPKRGPFLFGCTFPRDGLSLRVLQEWDGIGTVYLAPRHDGHVLFMVSISREPGYTLALSLLVVN